MDTPVEADKKVLCTQYALTRILDNEGEITKRVREELRLPEEKGTEGVVIHMGQRKTKKGKVTIEKKLVENIGFYGRQQQYRYTWKTLQLGDEIDEHENLRKSKYSEILKKLIKEIKLPIILGTPKELLQEDFEILKGQNELNVLKSLKRLISDEEEENLRIRQRKTKNMMKRTDNEPWHRLAAQWIRETYGEPKPPENLIIWFGPKGVSKVEEKRKEEFIDQSEWEILYGKIEAGKDRKSETAKEQVLEYLMLQINVIKITCYNFFTALLL
ncbi:8792_t:CDS:2 [Diversispora eburnea]|uniref:8792_t:CDS:1 n=1 Tax=Diversispora eburnea TaxID=1213867 RepID=A0A9N9GAC5_9GLOM|nr:8792_t:CDS:2 [Diversispora eburnea]